MYAFNFNLFLSLFVNINGLHGNMYWMFCIKYILDAVHMYVHTWSYALNICLIFNYYSLLFCNSITNPFFFYLMELSVFLNCYIVFQHAVHVFHPPTALFFFFCYNGTVFSYEWMLRLFHSLELYIKKRPCCIIGFLNAWG